MIRPDQSKTDNTKTPNIQEDGLGVSISLETNTVDSFIQDSLAEEANANARASYHSTFTSGIKPIVKPTKSIDIDLTPSSESVTKPKPTPRIKRTNHWTEDWKKDNPFSKKEHIPEPVHVNTQEIQADITSDIATESTNIENNTKNHATTGQMVGIDIAVNSENDINPATQSMTHATPGKQMKAIKGMKGLDLSSLPDDFEELDSFDETSDSLPLDNDKPVGNIHKENTVSMLSGVSNTTQRKKSEPAKERTDKTAKPLADDEKAVPKTKKKGSGGALALLLLLGVGVGTGVGLGLGTGVFHQLMPKQVDDTKTLEKPNVEDEESNSFITQPAMQMDSESAATSENNSSLEVSNKLSDANQEANTSTDTSALAVVKNEDSADSVNQTSEQATNKSTQDISTETVELTVTKDDPETLAKNDKATIKSKIPFLFQDKDDAESTDKTNDVTKQESPVLTVEVISPQVAEVPNNITADGLVTAKNIASISSKVNGLTIERVLVEEGQWVDKGDVLATFDTKTLKQNAIQAEASIEQAKINIRKAEATVAQANVNLAKAEADLNRVLPLLEIGAISEQQVDSYRVQVEQNKTTLSSAMDSVASAESGLISAKSKAKNQKINLQDSTLVSPISGIISKKSAQVGSLPQGSLFTIIEDGLLEWKAEVSPKEAKKIKVGMVVGVKTDTDTDSNNFIKGKVSRIDPVASNNRQIPIYVSLESKKGIQSGMLLPGMFVVGKDNETIVPISSIVSNDGYDYIMTVENIKNGNNKSELTGRIKRVKVTLGRQESNAVIIKSKIPSDLAVVRQGGSFLSDGDLVRIANE